MCPSICRLSVPVNQPTSCSSPQEVGQQREIAHEEKHPIDQRGNEPWTGQHRRRLINSSENSESLRNLGAFSFCKTGRRCHGVPDLLDFSYRTRGATEVAHFLRCKSRSPLVHFRRR